MGDLIVHRSLEVRLRIADKLKGRISPFKGKHHTPEIRNQIAISEKGRVPWSKGHTKEEFPQLSRTGVNKDCIPWNKGLTKETDIRLAEISKKESITHKELWKEHEYAKKMLHRRTPSGPEQIFIDLCKEFQYVGNGKLDIGGRNPDFVSVNKELKVIVEILGCFWHGCPEHFPNEMKQKEFEDRVQLFKSFGYSTLGIWEHELKHPKLVLEKVHAFGEGI